MTTDHEIEEATVFQPYTTSLELRQTRGYVDAYRHLDKSIHLGSATVMQRHAQVTDYEDMCEPTSTMMLVKVELTGAEGVPCDEDTVRQALKDTFGHHGCGHEHDCCGCWSTTVTDAVRRAWYPDEWMLMLSSSRNY